MRKYGSDRVAPAAWKDCMQKKGYSAGCASCMAQLVGCSRDHCMNQCVLVFSIGRNISLCSDSG